jgi:mitochondrial-processing peptidase subunit beta
VTSNFLRACHDLTEEEVNRAKNQLKASLLVQLDNYSNICEDIGRQMLTYDRRISLPEILSKVDQLTREDVILTARVIFGDADHALVGIGPIQHLPSYDWIRAKASNGGLY